MPEARLEATPFVSVPSHAHPSLPPISPRATSTRGGMWRSQSTSTHSAANNNNSSAHFRRHLCQMEARIAQKESFRSPRCHFALRGCRTAVPFSDIELWGSVAFADCVPWLFIWPPSSEGQLQGQARVNCRVRCRRVIGRGSGGSLTSSAPGEPTSRLPHGSCGRAPEPTHPAAMPLTH